MRRFQLGLVAVALVAAAATGHSYTTFAKWQSSPVTFYVNPSTPDLSSAAAGAATQFALDVWNTQGGTPFRYQYGGTTSDTTTGYDNRNVVIFRNTSNGSAIASTYTWWDSSNHLIDADVVVWDGGFTFFTGTSGCGSVSNAAYLEDVLTHEFGHALGLNHSTVTDATMYPSYGYCSQAMRTLASDDIAGVQSLYGVGSSGSTSSSSTATVPQMSSPATGSSLTGSSQTFTWTAGSSVSSYWLYVGTAVGANNLFDKEIGSSLTATVTGLPTDSRTLYVRLWWMAGSWNYAVYTYTAAAAGGGGGGGGGGTVPAITTPTAGATLAGSSQTFTWSAGSGATSFWLYVGTATGGYDLFNQSLGSTLTAGVAGLPTDGRKIYARLWWVRNGAWEYADTSYTAGTGGGGGGTGANPTITTPSTGSTLTGSTQTFAWTAGTGASSYWLSLGSAVGGNDLLDGNLGSSLSVTAAGLPTDGRMIYARLWWIRSGRWESADSSYRAK
jgi:hypothetical protein